MTFLLGWENGEARRSDYGFRAASAAQAEGQPALVRDTNGEGHWLVVAPTGTGKTASFVIPQLLSYRGPIVAVDVKGELAATTARHRRNLGEVVIFDPFGITGEGGSINPLGHIDPASDTLVDDAYTVANLFSKTPLDGKRGLDPFWDDWGQDVLAALIVYVLTAGCKVEPTLGTAYDLFHTDDHAYNLAVILDTKKVHPFFRGKIAQYLGLPEPTRGGVAATASQLMRMLAGQGVQRALASDSTDMELLSSGAPCTVYLVIPPDKLMSHAALIKMVISSLMQRLLRRRHKTEHPTMFLVDEATQFGAVPALISSITLGRSFGIRTALLVQSLAQLRSAYGTMTDAILENCSLMTMGKHTAFSMARQLAEQGFGDVSADALFSLSKDEAMVRIRGERSRGLTKLNYLSNAMFKGRFDRNPLYDTKQQAAVRAKYCGREDNAPPMQPSWRDWQNSPDVGKGRGAP